MTRIVFFGTPKEAVPTLDRLVFEYEIGLVVTQPDRPRERSGKPASPPVKERAMERGLTVAQPEDKTRIITAVKDAGHFDLGVVVAYGQILRPEVLDHPAHGILNVHFSLLPRWRGAAPVARALMAGDDMTGVSLIKLDEGLDTGPVLTAQGVDIQPGDDRGTLGTRLAVTGARLLVRSIPAYLSGKLVPVAQSDEGATYAARITGEDRPLDDETDRDRFINKVRGLSPTPGATLSLDGSIHKILAAAPVDTAPTPGTWVAIDGQPVVSVGGRGVSLTKLQAPGRNSVAGTDWVRGRHQTRGTLP